jgi:hypothetical protein
MDARRRIDVRLPDDADIAMGCQVIVGRPEFAGERDHPGNGRHGG